MTKDKPSQTTAPDGTGAITQTDAALDMIRSRIIDLTIEPGSRIDERLLVERFRLGRTPAREAMNRLAAEGFVTLRAQRGGTYVRKLDLDEMGEVLVAQQLVESILGQMCRIDDPALPGDLEAIQVEYEASVRDRRFLDITRLNQDFHLRMHRAVGNSLFYDFAETTHRHVRRLLVAIYVAEQAEPSRQSEQFTANLDQHREIIAAIREGDRETLTTLLPHHASFTQTRLVSLLQSKRLGPLRLDLAGLRGLSPREGQARD